MALVSVSGTRWEWELERTLVQGLTAVQLLAKAPALLWLRALVLLAGSPLAGCLA